MAPVKEIEARNKIDEQEMSEVTRILFNSFITHGSYRSITSLIKKEKAIDMFQELISNFLNLHISPDKKSKLELINFLDKLNMQKELLELQRGEISDADIKTAGKRLGKKAQSAFD